MIMAVPKLARVVSTRSAGARTRILELALEDGAPFGFRGGQYAIVNTGAVLASGAPAKRAYSFFSDDREQSRVQVAVKRLDDGPGSNALHRAEVGATFAFSGPWGKSYPDESTGSPSLLFASDTGITAAIGLARSAAFAPHAHAATLVWYVPPEHEFLSESFVRDVVAKAGVALSIERGLAVGHPERVLHAEAAIARHVAERGAPKSAFLSGDGLLVYAVRAQLVALGMNEAQGKLEAFFNNPARKAPR